MKKYILALDQGTTSSRAILFDKRQNIVGMAQQDFKQIFPQPGWVEHDPNEIFSSQYNACLEVLKKCGVDASEIAAIGITNQRETTILWDKNTGEPVYNAIVWQCRRTSGLADALKAQGLSEAVQKTTGLPIDAYFSATKIQWMLANIPGLRKRAESGDILFGTVETWLIWKLTGGQVHVTDYTNASRTMLFDIHRLRWDAKLLKAMNIPEKILPRVVSNSEVYGYADINGQRIPIAGAIGDQQAALFGQCCYEVGQAKITYGTGCFLLMNTGDKARKSANGLITTIAAGIGGQIRYALEGSVFIGGAVIQWMRDELKMIHSAPDAEYFASKVDDTDGVYLVPAFTGLGAPYWNQYARGCLIGLTRGTKSEHIVRAAEESIAYQCMDVVRAMEKDSKTAMTEIQVDGGASRDAFLMQFQADLLDTVVIRPVIRETTALGAASMAGLAVGFWKDTAAIQKLHRTDVSFAPRMDASKRDRLIDGWHKAVDRSLDWDC